MSELKINRREFLATGSALAVSRSGLQAAEPALQTAKNMMGGYSAVIPRSKIEMSPSCGSMLPLKDGRIMWLWGTGSLPRAPYTMQANFSSDGGRTWSDPEPLKLKTGSNLPAFFNPNLARLKSGRIGLVQTQRAADFNNPSRSILSTTFHISEDEGKTWSEGIAIPCGTRESAYYDQLHVLSNGRLIVPFQCLMGPTPKANSGISALHGTRFNNGRMTFAMSTITAYWSDDEGMTWKRSFNEVFASAGSNGAWRMLETGIAELADGRVLMLGHSGIKRVYRAYSADGGETWLEGEPTELQCAGPVSVKRIPGTADVLLLWVQMSGWEQMSGYYRHRLSSAITSDGGKTFHSFKNLESLDDVAQVETEPLEAQMQSSSMKQPIDTSRYPRAPGPLRCDHPFCTFSNGNAIIGYGTGVSGDPEVITRFYGESLEHFCQRFGFEVNKRNPRRVIGSNKVRVIPISDL